MTESYAAERSSLRRELHFFHYLLKLSFTRLVFFKAHTAVNLTMLLT